MQYGLLVGVNLYQEHGNDLRGCVHDVDNMRTLLGACGFSVMHVRSLTDEQATKKRILGSLTQMVQNMKEGDHGVFHFSGHGSQIPCTEGDESDGMDEVLCPYDFRWDGTYIKDDDLHRLLEALHPLATLDVFLDCCHSGTGLREIGDVARCIPYPFPLSSSRGFWSYKQILRGHDLPNVALWAGCRDDQTSADAMIDGKMQGAMTWGVVASMTQGLSQYAGFDLRGNLIETIKVLLGQKGFDQEPQLEASDGMKVRKVFE